MDESNRTQPSNKHIIPADSITTNKQLGVGEFGIVQQGVWTVNGNERVRLFILFRMVPLLTHFKCISLCCYTDPGGHQVLVS